MQGTKLRKDGMPNTTSFQFSSRMHIESITKCFLGAFCNTYYCRRQSVLKINPGDKNSSRRLLITSEI